MEAPSSTYTYKVIFFTGSLSWSGTNANVDLTMYGDGGESKMYLFRNKTDSTIFKSGMRNQYTITSKKSLGALYRVRVGHDNSGPMPAWFLEKILIEDEATRVYYEFNCYKWFDSATGDLRIRRFIRSTRDFIQHEAEQIIEQEEIVIEEYMSDEEEEIVPEPEEAQNEDMVLESVPEPDFLENEELLESSLPGDLFEDTKRESNYNYIITIYTGSKTFSGTDANVYLKLHGTQEQTPEEHVFENRGNRTFEKGVKNSYPIQSKISLDDLSRLTVGHDNRGIFPGWYLESVELEDADTGQKIQFPCNQWLWSMPIFKSQPAKCDLTREDAIDSPPLKTPSSPEKQMVNALSSSPNPSLYTIHLVSEVAYGSLSEDRIVFTLYGKNGHSEQQTFDQQENVVFEKRMRGTLQFKCQNHLGSIEKIKIGLESNKGKMPWILVVVVDNESDENTVFMCDCCLVNDEKNAHVQHVHFPVFAGAMNDIMSLDKDHGEEWTLMKATNDIAVWSRNDTFPKRPPIIKAKITLDDVPCPYRTAVKHFTDWEERKRWDKTFEAVKVLEKIGDFTLVQCTLKLPFYATNREMVLACLDITDQRYHIQVMRNAHHPRVLFNNKQIRAETLKSGTVIHRLDLNDDQPTSITVISQIELGGWLQSRAKRSYLADNPVKQIEFLKTYLNQRKPSIRSASEKDNTESTSTAKGKEGETGNNVDPGVLTGTKQERERGQDLPDFKSQNGSTTDHKAVDKRFQELTFDTIDGRKEHKVIDETRVSEPTDTKTSRTSFVSRSKTENGTEFKLESKEEKKDDKKVVEKTHESVNRSSGSIFSRHLSWKFNSTENGMKSSPNSENAKHGGESLRMSDSKNSRVWRSNTENGIAQENFLKMNATNQDFQNADKPTNRFFTDSKLIQWLKIR